MRQWLIALALSPALGGCDRPAEPRAVDGSVPVSVRRIDVAPETNRQELAFEIIVAQSGSLTFFFGHEGSQFGVVGATPGKKVLRVIRDSYDGKAIVDQFVAPLFGVDAAQRLRLDHPDAADRRIIATTLRLEEPSGVATAQMTSLAPIGFSTWWQLANDEVRQVAADPLRLAAWLHVPSTGRAGGGIGPSNVSVSIDGQRLSIEEARERGAVFTELTMKFEPDAGPTVVARADAQRSPE